MCMCVIVWLGVHVRDDNYVYTSLIILLFSSYMYYMHMYTLSVVIASHDLCVCVCCAGCGKE